MRLALASIILVLLCRPASSQEPPPRAEVLKGLLAEKKEADEKFVRDFSDAGDDLGKNIARYDGWPGWDFATRLVEFAEAAPEDQSALAACRKSLESCYAVGVNDRRSAACDERAWSIIEKYHLTSPEIGELCILASRYDSSRRVRFLEKVLADGPAERKVRALATYGLAEIRYAQAVSCEMDGMVHADPAPFVAWFKANRWDPAIRAELKSENYSHFAAMAAQLYRTIQEEYADVPAGEGQGTTRSILTLGGRAAQRLYALEHLSIGSQAPELEGLDLEGKPLRLTDYRGKVVVITFWFSGCGPCMAMVPHEKQLVDDLRGKPFQMLSVCNDASLETAKATVAGKGMTWPNWYDGMPLPDGLASFAELSKQWKGTAGVAPAGAIARQWNVDGWPTIFVLDEKGIIRAKELIGEELVATVHRLVAAVEKR